MKAAGQSKRRGGAHLASPSLSSSLHTERMAYEQKGPSSWSSGGGGGAKQLAMVAFGSA